MEEAVIILSVLLVSSILFIINLSRKVEANEDYVEELEKSNTDFYIFFKETCICFRLIV